MRPSSQPVTARAEDRRLRTEPSTSTSGIGKKRVDELTIALRHSELTPASYITTAFDFPEVLRVEIHRFRDGWDASKVEELLPGFDASGIERYLLDRHKPGSYRFSVIVPEDDKDRSLAWRTFSLGDAPPPAAPANGHASSASSTAVTADQVLRDLANRLQATMTTSQLSGIVADLEAARTNRELAPQKMLLEALGTLIAKSGAPNPGNDAIVQILRDELNATRQELREIRAAGTKPAEPAPGVAKIAEDIKAIATAGELIGLTRTTSKSAPTSMWTPDAMKTAFEAAAPIVGRFADMFDRFLESKLNGGVPALPRAAAPGGSPMPEAQLPPQLVEQINFLLEALRSRDFPTVAWMLDNVFVRPDGGPLVPIDPDVKPLAYVMKIKPFAPKIDELRAELGEFLAWVKKQREAEGAAPAAAGAARP